MSGKKHSRTRRRRGRKSRRSKYNNRGGSRRRRRRRRRRRTRRKQSGGGYGFSAKGVPNWGKRGVNWTRYPNSCKNFKAAQRGGGLDSKDLGYSLGGGGQISYGYDSKVAPFAKDLRGSYAPVARTLRPQCGSGKRRRTNRKRNRSRSRKSRRQQRGGYHQYQSNTPLTPSYTSSNTGNWTTATHVPIKRVNNCNDNYNHFVGAGSPSPVLDQAAVY